jgi:DNA-binding transcriptional ArsR family regulator
MNRPFEGLLGNNCELRMLEFLLPLHGIEFNISELAKEAGVSRVTATRIIKKFVDWEVLTPVKRGNVTYYSINHNSPIVKTIEQLNNVIIEKMLGDEILYEIHEYWKNKTLLLPIKPATEETTTVFPLLQTPWEPQPWKQQTPFYRDEIPLPTTVATQYQTIERSKTPRWHEGGL